MSINREMGKEDAVQIYNVMLLSHKKEQNNAIRSNMVGPGEVRQRKTNAYITDMWNIKK